MLNSRLSQDTNNVEVFKRELRDQWIDSNLLDLESSCLPPNLAGQRHTKLPKQYGLQVSIIFYRNQQYYFYKLFPETY